MIKQRKIIPIFLLLAFFSCEKINKKSPIPDSRLDFELHILRDAPELNIVGNYKVIDKPLHLYQYIGYGGLLFYHTFDDEIVVFDLACPYEANPEVRVDSITIIGEAVCRKCHSVYDVAYGTGAPRKGVSTHYLRKYRTYFTGDIIRITK
ncbi:MAG: hypothetical protein J6P95_03050 [Paludibacteraceae bacterium]|nr:hypothetical protein [Paludibacteraceae bacterium]